MRGITRLLGGRTPPARVFGLLMTRDAVDVVEACLRHHLGLGVERMLVVDNGSTDGTFELLQRLSGELPLDLGADDGPFQQGHAFTRLAHEAARRGADWVLPLDADEFWVTSGDPLPALLARRRAGALKVQVVNFIQRREQRDPDPRALLNMTMRVPVPLPQNDSTRALLNADRLSFFEIQYPPKHIVRAVESVVIGAGNHRVSDVPGAVKEDRALQCLHAPLRSKRDLELRAEQGKRVEARGYAPDESWHVRRWARMEREEILVQDWPAHSYADGRLDVYGRPAELVADVRLRDIVAPLVPGP